MHSRRNIALLLCGDQQCHYILTVLDCGAERKFYSSGLQLQQHTSNDLLSFYMAKDSSGHYTPCQHVTVRLLY
jgi:hypothetical protein